MELKYIFERVSFDDAAVEAAKERAAVAMAASRELRRREAQEGNAC